MARSTSRCKICQQGRTAQRHFAKGLPNRKMAPTRRCRTGLTASGSSQLPVRVMTPTGRLQYRACIFWHGPAATAMMGPMAARRRAGGSRARPPRYPMPCPIPTATRQRDRPRRGRRANRLAPGWPSGRLVSDDFVKRSAWTWAPITECAARLTDADGAPLVFADRATEFLDARPGIGSSTASGCRSGAGEASTCRPSRPGRWPGASS